MLDFKTKIDKYNASYIPYVDEEKVDYYVDDTNFKVMYDILYQYIKTHNLYSSNLDVFNRNMAPFLMYFEFEFAIFSYGF